MYRPRAWIPLITAALFGSPAFAVTFDWVTVGDPGNACDLQPQGCFGAVAATYQISRTEVTNADYAEFLNAVAASDPNALFNDGMSYWGMSRGGSNGSYTYTVGLGFEDKPVAHVSFWDTLRFANWIQNGQPIGAQGPATTEDGAYTLTAVGMASNSVTRNPGATIVLTSEDEWYKAAYYDALSQSYFDYPAGTDLQTVCTGPGATPNTANCDVAVANLTEVGSYTGSPSPSGTFDQGGNLWEWSEDIAGPNPVQRGGSFSDDGPEALAASYRITHFAPTGEFGTVGFRLASVPEPGTAALVALGFTALAVQRRDWRA